MTSKNNTPYSASAVRVDALFSLPGGARTHNALGGREWRRALTRRIAKAAKARKGKGGQQ